MSQQVRIEGYEIISAGGTLADVNRKTPDGLKIDAGVRFFQQVSIAALVVHGRNLHENKRARIGAPTPDRTLGVSAGLCSGAGTGISRPRSHSTALHEQAARLRCRTDHGHHRAVGQVSLPNTNLEAHEYARFAASQELFTMPAAHLLMSGSLQKALSADALASNVRSYKMASLEANEAEYADRGHRVLYVLVTSLAFAAIAMIVVALTAQSFL